MNPFINTIRLFHTVRYLKSIQIFYRLYYKIIKPTSGSTSHLKVRDISWQIKFPTYKKSLFSNDKSFEFMKIKRSLKKEGWKIINVPDLWLYNLHYFDDLNSPNSSEREDFLKELLSDWIKNNKQHSSIGWDSYPLSLRLVNIIKWIINVNNSNEELISSMKKQYVWLSKRIEWHILGNHLFANAKALFFGSLFFENKKNSKILKKSLKIINRELKEQILDDGGHFELSPMYHAIILEDLLDIINLSMQFPEVVDENQIINWKGIASKMITWLENMSHPDEKITFFNDAAFGISLEKVHLINYAKTLGIKVMHGSSRDKIVCNHMKDSGYISIKNDFGNLYIDVANIGAKYLPGHGHADVLSFELSINKQRVFVNSGTSTYDESSSLRMLQRGTSFHNTVVISDMNSSDVWRSFRVGRRANPFDLSIIKDSNQISVECSHNGYRNIKTNPIHTRKWIITNESIEINDRVDNKDIRSSAYFILHPNVKILSFNKDRLMLGLHDDTIVYVIFSNTDLEIIGHTFSPEFGVDIETKAIKVNNAFNYSCRILKNINEEV